MKLSGPQSTGSGFTLIEMLISVALAAMIITAGYMCLSSAMATQKIIEPRVEIFQNARVAMNLISADLRSACPLSPDFEFLGTPRTLENIEADNLDFATHNYTPQHPREADFCEVSVFLEKDPKTGQYVLLRRRNPMIAPDPLSGGSREEIARGLRGMKFEYYDGFDWYDSWGDLDGKTRRKGSRKEQPNLSGMPTAVRITLSFDSNPQAKPVTSDNLTTDESTPKEPPFVFSTVTYLELAAASAQQTASASSATNNAPADNSQGNNNGGPIQ